MPTARRYSSSARRSTEDRRARRARCAQDLQAERSTRSGSEDERRCAGNHPDSRPLSPTRVILGACVTTGRRQPRRQALPVDVQRVDGDGLLEKDAGHDELSVRSAPSAPSAPSAEARLNSLRRDDDRAPRAPDAPTPQRARRSLAISTKYDQAPRRGVRGNVFGWQVIGYGSSVTVNSMVSLPSTVVLVRCAPTSNTRCQ